MKIVFFGTPEYVLPILTSLHRKFVTGPGKSPISAVVTQGPKPVGRKQIPTYSPIDKWAHERRIPIYYSGSELLKKPPEAEIGILAAYGEILSKEVINFFPRGILVIHPSLLPKYRGASPIQAAIAAGETLTGVTIFKMDEKVDHGPIVVQLKENIDPSDTGETLRTRLFEKSADVLIELIEPYFKGKVKPKTQNQTDATFTNIIKKEDGHVDLEKDDPVEIERKFRAYAPWPGIWTLINGKRLKILKLHLNESKLVLDEVQLEGKNPVSWTQFEVAYLKEKLDL